MKLSNAWLQEYLSKKLDVKQSVIQMTSAGLEVDGVSPVAPEFSHVVVAEIIDVKPHPDAEKLKVCTVNTGGSKPITIVTNVASVRANMKVPAAMVGAILPDGMKITKAKLRGVESQGMFCGAETLGIGDAAAGLLTLPKDAPVGKDIREYLQLDDVVIDVELTPNRGDCLSIEGIARELAVANECDLKEIKINEIPVHIKDVVDVEIKALEACPRYLARVFRNINSAAITPTWMQERLRRGGLRSIHPVVDVTNYVMLEMGQPLHAFDAATLDGGIVVRFAKAKEKLQLLDGQEIELSKEILVIADKKQVLAMAGIMGGLTSAVSTETKDIVLECAFFDPLVIMGKARQYGLHTDSSHRFERGVDPELPMRAMRRVTQLLMEIVGGTPGPIVEQVNASYLPKREAIKLRHDRLNTYLGCVIDESKISNILKQLGMEVKEESHAWMVTPPSYRFDIAIEVDLIEEVARIYGYNNLPTRKPMSAIQIQAEQLDYRLADTLCALGYQEAMTYSFTEPSLCELLMPQVKAVALTNPISPELSVMRTTLWAGLLRAAQHNVNRQQSRLRFFESGLRFVTDKKAIHQIPTLAGLVMGSVVSEQWGQASRAIDFYDIKADLEVLLALTGRPYEFISAEHPALHPGRCAKIVQGQREIGYLGALHPKIQQQLNLPEVYLFELDIEKCQQLLVTPTYQPVSKYPAVRRDIAVLINENKIISDICKTIRNEAGNLLNSLVIFDVYRGDGIVQGKKSVALGLVWQAVDRTLSDDEINALMQKVLQALKDEHQATLRE